MIFMLFSNQIKIKCRSDIKFQTSCSRNMSMMLGLVVFKLYKKQTNSENHEISQNAMISYVESVIKIGECFMKVVTYDAYKLVRLRRSFR